MKKTKNKSWLLLLAIPMLISVAGCTKFLDRKPLTATLGRSAPGSPGAPEFWLI